MTDPVPMVMFSALSEQDLARLIEATNRPGQSEQ